MKKSEALKNVPVTSLEQIVDNAMDYLPNNLDLSLPENRLRIRNWMVRVCGVVATENARSFSAAATSAIEEAAALTINPQYYQERKRRKEKYKAMRALVQVSEKPKTKAQVEFDRLGDSSVRM